jgi:predicted transcriptional regulator
MTKKLDKEHVEQITTLRESFSQNSITIGSIETELMLMQERTKKLQAEKEKYYAQFTELRKQESDLIEKMRERYGDGQINLEDGTFTQTSGLAQ